MPANNLIFSSTTAAMALLVAPMQSRMSLLPATVARVAAIAAARTSVYREKKMS
jgi:hypothetical protein